MIGIILTLLAVIALGILGIGRVLIARFPAFRVSRTSTFVLLPAFRAYEILCS